MCPLNWQGREEKKIKRKKKLKGRRGHGEYYIKENKHAKGVKFKGEFYCNLTNISHIRKHKLPLNTMNIQCL